MTTKLAAWPDVRAKLEAKRAHAQRRVDHFQGAATATIDPGERTRLEYLVEYWTGNLQGLDEVLEIASELEMQP